MLGKESPVLTLLANLYQTSAGGGGCRFWWPQDFIWRPFYSTQSLVQRVPSYFPVSALLPPPPGTQKSHCFPFTHQLASAFFIGIIKNQLGNRQLPLQDTPSRFSTPVLERGVSNFRYFGGKMALETKIWVLVYSLLPSDWVNRTRKCRSASIDTSKSVITSMHECFYRYL